MAVAKESSRENKVTGEKIRAHTFQIQPKDRTWERFHLKKPSIGPTESILFGHKLGKLLHEILLVMLGNQSKNHPGFYMKSNLRTITSKNQNNQRISSIDSHKEIRNRKTKYDVNSDNQFTNR